MNRTDSRSLSDDALIERRKQVVRCRLNGLGLKDSAAQCSMSRHAANRAWQLYKKKGWLALETRRTGRPEGSGHLLTDEQQGETQRLISDKMPDQLKLPYALWSRKAVRQLIKERYGVELAARTMTEYMRRWGFTSQKPMRRAMEQRPAEVRRWKEKAYPAIAKRAKAERAEILWGDETGVRSDDVPGRSFAKRGHTPIVRVGHKRFGRSIISAVSARGGMRWMIFKGAKRKVFLIVDNLRVHHAKVLSPWLLKHKRRIELFYLPSYSPEINPVEVANADLKRTVGDKPPAPNEQQMVKAVIAHYRSVQKQPHRVMAYFNHPDVRYAA